MRRVVTFRPPEATKIFHDIETFPLNFSWAMVNLAKRKVTVVVINESEVYRMENVLKRVQESYPTYDVHFMDGKDKTTWDRLSVSFFNDFTDEYPVEWYGWNSKKYDLFILSVIFAFIKVKERLLTTREIRQLSDLIIQDNKKYGRLFFGAVEELFPESLDVVDRAKELYYDALSGLMHIDVGSLNESGGSGRKGMTFMYSLKETSAYVGLDVLDDELTKVEFNQWGNSYYENLDDTLKERLQPNGALTSEGLVGTLVYNIRDVINTGLIFQEPEYEGVLGVKDTLRETYDYITLHPKGYTFGQVPRDGTMAQLSGKLIRGEEQVALSDIPAVSFEHTFADGHKENLLDYVDKHEKLHPKAKAFFRHFEGKRTAKMEHLQSVIEQSPTGKSTMTIPYMTKEWKASSAYITLSTGGAHGAVGEGYYNKPMQGMQSWLDEMAVKGVPTAQKVTVDVSDVIHMDFSSYYPSMNIQRGVYRVGDTDNYETLRDERVKLKEQLPSNKQEWTDDDREKNRIQNAQKLILNAATGASNKHQQDNQYEDLPLDNAILSMRLTGNVLIYILGQWITEIGGFIPSTNTDGLYVVGITQEQAQELCDKFMSIYGLDIEPEPMSRLISRNANERIEFEGDKISAAGGDLRRSLDDTPSPALNGQKRQRLDGFPSFPRVCGKAILSYLEDYQEWLENPIDYKLLREEIKAQLKDDMFRPLDWVIVLKGSRLRKYYKKIDGEKVPMQQTNRVYLSETADRVVHEYREKAQKMTSVTTDKLEVVNTQETLNHINKDDLDVDAYVNWATNMLELWHKRGDVPEIGMGEPPKEQLTLFDMY